MLELKGICKRYVTQSFTQVALDNVSLSFRDNEFVAILGPQIPGVHWFAALLLAVLAGAFWGAIVGFLKAKYQVSEVVATIMLNYIALYASRILVMRIPGTNTYRTPSFPETA